MMKDRLQKIMAAAGLASRRQAETWISAGRVTVNGRIAELGESADPQVDKILVDGKALSTQTTLYYVLLNKPSGYVTSRQDPQGRACVIDLVKDLPVRLNPVGRLDLTTEGLLLLMTFPKVPRSAQAPTEAEIELYVDRTGLFVEVEQQGPYEPIPPGGESTPWVVRFQVHVVPAEVPVSPGPKLLTWVRSLVA
jgi:23S rRNA pseudouridine2605 synthase